MLNQASEIEHECIEIATVLHSLCPMVYQLLHHVSAQNQEVQMPMVECVTSHAAELSNYGILESII